MLIFKRIGYVYKHNCRSWGEENLHVIHETPMWTPKKLLCGAHSGHVEYWAFFSENDEDQMETVNIERYRRMITDYYWHEIEDYWCGGDMLKEGGICRTSHVKLDVLREKFSSSKTMRLTTLAFCIV